jgi:hypothetical protein
MEQRLTAILPCNDLDAAQAFFERLGFKWEEGSPDGYRMLSDGQGGFVYLNRAVEGWLEAGRNPFGLYLYREDVDAVAASFAGETLGPPRDTPWGMYEFALNGPDDTLVRVGWPTRLRNQNSH